MSQLSHAQFPLRRHPHLLVDHRRAGSASVADSRGADAERLTGSDGRLHFGMVADIKSERWPASNRNRWPDCAGIRRLAGLKFEHAAHHIVLEDCIAAVEAATARRDRLEAHIEAALPDWSLAPVVRALQALRGMAMVAAATVIAELGDITRF